MLKELDLVFFCSQMCHNSWSVMLDCFQVTLVLINLLGTVKNDNLKDKQALSFSKRETTSESESGRAGS